MSQPTLVEIPQPPTKTLLGNLLDLDRHNPIQGFGRLAKEYGPIYKLTLRGRTAVLVSSYELVNELCDEARFDKSIEGALRKVRQFGGDGLFTAETSEPNWQKAHHILLPNFSQRAMRSYHPAMVDIATQLITKLERLNPDDEVDVAREMTALTLDTIGLAGFDYRFNSFYREGNHPFVEAMVDALTGAMQQMQRMPGEDLIRRKRDRKFWRDIGYMNNVADRLVRERREAGADIANKPDLLNYMLAGVDKKSGEKLDDLNIRYQMITFLIAGHETTSGLLSFAINALLNNAEVLKRAYAEVDRILGPDPKLVPTYEQVVQLTYITQILKETLRLWPTAPAFALRPKEDTVLGGKYEVKKDYQILVLLFQLHRDPAIWGSTPEVFDPDNFTPEAERKRPANAYKPFGNGQRSCIGRQFAMQEATLVLGMLLHRFRMIDHKGYRLKIRESLTIKPEGFKIKVRPRLSSERAPALTTGTAVPRDMGINGTAAAAMTAAQGSHPAVATHGTPLLVLYGSNLGTAEEIAHRMAQEGEAQGYAVRTAPLDEAVEHLPADGAVLIVTASYNGTPPDNAAKFCAWLSSPAMNENALAGVKYSVFGCGNRDWAATFQAIPRLIDEKLAAHGATRIAARGEGDARDDFDGQFQAWNRGLWPDMARTLGVEVVQADVAREPLYQVEVLDQAQTNPIVETLNARRMKIVENRELHTRHGAAPSERSTRHLEVELPQGTSYFAGDHLGVVPHNPLATVQRVARRFGFEDSAVVRIRKTAKRRSSLPVDEPIAVETLLRDYVELQAPATRSQVEVMARFTACPPEKQKLAALIADDEGSAARYRDEILTKRKSVIDLLEECPACDLPFGAYLEMLSPLAPRYYSISSSPLANPSRCSLTVAVVAGPALAGHGEYRGVCSNYLLEQEAGDGILAAVRDNHSRFRLPDDPATPIIMIGPGTGLAPFRGFIQERAVLKNQARTVGPALLFFGCRHPEQDFIYADELRAWNDQGVVELQTAFSRLDPSKKCYVQDKLRECGDRVWGLIEQGAIIYVCGDASQMAPSVRHALAELYADRKGATVEQGEAWIDQLMVQNRYLVDVWSAS